MYFGDLLDGLDSFHSDLDLFEILCCEGELVLEQQRSSVLKTTGQHNKLNMIYEGDQQLLIGRGRVRVIDWTTIRI